MQRNVPPTNLAAVTVREETSILTNLSSLAPVDWVSLRWMYADTLLNGQFEWGWGPCLRSCRPSVVLAGNAVAVASAVTMGRRAEMGERSGAGA